MDRKKITAYLIDCKEDEFLVYREEGELGSVAVGPDGKKYRFSIEQLEKGEIAMELDAAERQPEAKPKAAAPAKPKAEPAKRSRATTTKRKAPAKRKTSTKK